MNHSKAALAKPANRWRLVAALASGLLLWSAYPPLDQSDSAWFALIPLILLARHTRPHAAFGWGWLAGMAFWVPSLSWLWRLIGNGGPWQLVVLGQTALAAYCALFFGLYGLASASLWQRVARGSWRGWRLLAIVAAEPLLWAGSEYLRGVLFSGFPWNTLAVSQVSNVALLQPAAWGGAAVVSAILFGVSAGVAGMLERIAQPLFNPGGRRAGFDLWRSAEGVAPVLIMVICWLGGLEQLRGRLRNDTECDEWRVVLVQPATPSIFEITDEIVLAQRRVLLDLSTLAAAAQPDLVIWPETAVQGMMPTHPDVMRLAGEAAHAAGAPLLTGTIEAELGLPGEAAARQRYYNAAWLFDLQGMPAGRYRKQHLVPFGEFIPGDRWFPALERLSPVGFSCTPGRESTILRIATRPGADPARELPFSPLICFEDLFSRLSRRAVRHGARLLVNITNDAWFEGSTENEQHLRQAVLRCIENRVPMVRAANTGVTAMIDATGRVTRFAPGGDTGAAGFMPVSVRVPPASLPPTRFNRLGDWGFGIPAAFLTVIAALLGCRRVKAQAAVAVNSGQ